MMPLLDKWRKLPGARKLLQGLQRGGSEVAWSANATQHYDGLTHAPKPNGSADLHQDITSSVCHLDLEPN
jgi:hypothetical protein